VRRIAILDAPSNLGLRPPTETSVPGCAKAPGALRDQGLLTRLGARDAGCLTPPRYDAGDWRPGDGVAHAAQIAAYSRALADRIGAILDAGEFPVILGGDCSILLGSGIAMHRLGQAIGGNIGLVFVDGHSDFRHPGNASYVGAAAGEDLALVTGRGQPDLASIEGRRPYFRDVDVVVMGIRAQDEHRLDLQAAGIVTRPVPALRAEGAARSAQWARDQLTDCAGYWVHVDVDVLDPAVMPAVDAPSPGGIAFPELELLLAGLVESPHCLGVELTVFDPDYDPDGQYAAEITSAVTAGLAAAHHVAQRPDLAAARRDLDRSARRPPDDEAAPDRRRAEVARDHHRDEPRERRVGGLARERRLGEATREHRMDEAAREHRSDEVAREHRSDEVAREHRSDEVAREHRRAEAAAASVSLAAAGASGDLSGMAEQPAIPATTLLAVGDGAEFAAEQPLDGIADPADYDAAADAIDADADDAKTDDADASEANVDEAGELAPVDVASDEVTGPDSETAGADAIHDYDDDAAAEFESGVPAGLSPLGEDPAEDPDVEVASRAEDPDVEVASRAEDPDVEVASRAEDPDVEVASRGKEPDFDVASLDEGSDVDVVSHDDGRPNGSRLGPRNGSADGEASVRLLGRPLGSAPLLDSEPLPATRPGMLRPRRPETDDDQAGARDTEGFSLPVQRPVFDIGSDEPADIA
jgi:arginase